LGCKFEAMKSVPQFPLLERARRHSSSPRFLGPRVDVPGNNDTCSGCLILSDPDDVIALRLWTYRVGKERWIFTVPFSASRAIRSASSLSPPPPECACHAITHMRQTIRAISCGAYQRSDRPPFAAAWAPNFDIELRPHGISECPRAPGVNRNGLSKRTICPRPSLPQALSSSKLWMTTTSPVSPPSAVGAFPYSAVSSNLSDSLRPPVRVLD